MANYKLLIEQYHEMEGYLRDTLSDTLRGQLMLDHKVAAHDILKTLMEYKLIPLNDPLTSVNTKAFAGEDGVDVKSIKNWGAYDYRRATMDCQSLGFLPKYLFCPLGNYTVFDVKTLGHWGKRVEGNFEGDIFIPDSAKSIRMDLIDFRIPALRAVEEIQKICANTPLADEFIGLKEAAEVGAARIFRLEVSGNTLSKYKNIGYAVLHTQDGEVIIATLIDYNAILGNWFDVGMFENQFEAAIRKCVKNEKLSITNLKDAPLAAVKQKLLMKKSEETGELLKAKVAKAKAESTPPKKESSDGTVVEKRKPSRK